MPKRNQRDEEIQAVFELVNQGQFGKAQARIELLAKRSLTTPERVTLARAACAAKVPRQGLALLSARTRTPSGQLRSDAIPEAIIQFAQCLMLMGARGEAADLLATPAVASHPRARFMAARLKILSWEWEAAIPILEPLHAAGEKSGLDPSDQHWVDFYLGTSLIHADPSGWNTNTEQLKRALQIYGKIRENRRGSDRDVLDICQVMGQAHFFLKDFEAAEREFDTASKIRGFLSLQLVAERWKMQVQLARGKSSPELIEEISKCGRRLRELGEYELSRATDYYLAWQTKDARLAAQLYYGSPMVGFRQRLLNRMGWKPEQVPDRGIWSWEGRPLWTPDEQGPPSGSTLHRIDAGLGIDLKGTQSLRAGDLLERLLSSLLQDTYAPWSVGGLHAKLYPGQPFILGESEDRVWQALRRFRVWLKRKRIPLQVLEKDGSYHIVAEPNVRVWVPKPMDAGEVAPNTHPRLQILRKNLLAQKTVGQDFTAREVEAWLKVTRPTAIQVIAEARELGWVSQQGAGPKTKYIWVGDSGRRVG